MRLKTLGEIDVRVGDLLRSPEDDRLSTIVGLSGGYYQYELGEFQGSFLPEAEVVQLYREVEL